MSFANPAVGSLGWFARHEFNLSWRDFVRMMSAGKPGRDKAVLAFLVIAVLFVHVIAYLTLIPAIAGGIAVDKTTLAVVSGSLMLTFFLMMSQAMELVTRVFYSRSDLDLILSSPISERKLFTVRICAVALSTSMLSLLLFGAAINVLALFHSVWWLSAYPIILGFGALATALSLAITILMFRMIGAKKTRLTAQIVAAIVGAGFVIGIQLAAISSLGSISRIELLTSDLVLSTAPELDSFLWLPARAAMGDGAAFLLTLLLCLGSLVLAISVFAAKFGSYVVEAAGIGQGKSAARTSAVKFKSKSVAATLRYKEWKLLLRDHWLLSQTLMQILYLIPPAYMLWQGFGEGNSLAIVAIPVLVMATGQLAGGLAWLAVSGEDAPQLVATAPVSKGTVTRAKIEAVLGAIAILVAPILLISALIDLRLALVALWGVTASAISATMIQIWFRSQAKRSNFRRRQTSSKVATLSEAFSSILWAGAAGLAAAGSWLALALVPIIVLILWIARSFRPTAEI